MQSLAGQIGSEWSLRPPPRGERSQLRRRRGRHRRAKSESDLRDVAPLPAGAQLALGGAWPADPSRKGGSARHCLVQMDTRDRDPEPEQGAGGEAEQFLESGPGAGTLKASRIEATWGLCLHLWFWRRVAGILIAVPVILLLIWFSWSPPILPHLEPCRDDWLYYRKKCYYLSEDQANWDSSQSFCSAHGASLAVIESQQEMNFIMNRMRTRDSWIGLRKKGAEFYWVNGETLNTSLFPVYLSGHEECAHTDSISISTSECRLLRNWLCSVGLPQSSTLSP
ncbi:C-type lectin domain family 2 member L-like [Mauremys mutica]|uniref:C-type lectin domain family 2 member L-like n=1 Tax=Mauremys mutica TaxID=74926 RepID=UPI001D14C761|nr:C-type lectin domain family 2 member L-like [Mauremys mutica]